MPKNLLSAEDFRAAVKDGQRPEGTVFRLASSDPESVGDAKSRTKRFVFSDSTIDLAGDTIKQDGWELGNFNRNPVALFSHMSWEPPIGRAANVGVKGGKLVGDIEFAAPEVYEFADTVFRLVDAGFLKAVSVGFSPLEWSFSQDKDRPFGIDFKRQILNEISVCAVPCQPNALIEARSVGIDTRPMVEWAEKILDQGGSTLIPKIELDALRKGASESAPVRYYLTGGKNLSGSQIAVIKGEFDEWLAGDGKASLFLPDDLELKVIGEGAVPTVIKAGRKISAKNADALNKAMDHIKSVMDSDEPAEEVPAEEPAAEVVETVVDSKAALRDAAKATLAAARAA